jgi:hypothetical protein
MVDEILRLLGLLASMNERLTEREIWDILIMVHQVLLAYAQDRTSYSPFT